MAHIVEDAGWHRWEVDDVLGGRVVQAQAPPTAADREGGWGEGSGQPGRPTREASRAGGQGGGRGSKP